MKIGMHYFLITSRKISKELTMWAAFDDAYPNEAAAVQKKQL